MVYKGKDTVYYFEWIRVAGASAVVLLHVFATVLNNMSVSQVGVERAWIWSLIQIVLTSWAVPVFLMVTGALLLSDSRKLDYVKALSLSKRMVIILLTFGYLYCVCETFFDTNSFTLKTFIQSFLNLLEGHSWSHMWYLYALLGIYLLAPMCKAFAEKATCRDYNVLLVILLIFSTIIPVVNSFFDIKIVNLTWLTSSVFYFLLGHYLTNCTLNKNWCLIGVGALLILLLLVSLSIVFYQDYGNYLRDPSSMFIVGYSSFIFLLFKKYADVKFTQKSWVAKISKLSFGIYIVHPIFLNLLYKILDWNFNSLPPVIFEITTFIITFTCSVLLVSVLKLIPGLKKII